MIKSLVSVLALTASALALPGRQPAGLPQCKGDAPKSCEKLPPRSTKDCLASISKAWIPVETCTKPTSVSIVTVTETAKSKKWPTTTAVVTSTSTFTQHVNVTVSSTQVVSSIAVYTETVQASAWASVTSTQHVNTTQLVTATAKTTTTSTLTLDQTKETCAAARGLEADIEKRGGGNRLPDDCSCFLTSTSYTGVQTYTTTTTTTPTVTVTTTVPAKATVSTTWTITVPVTSTVVQSSAQYTTSTSTNTVTRIVSTTWVFTSTSTSTSIKTSTTTAALDVCATAAPLASGITGANVDGRSAAGKTFQDCCRSCFKADNCAFYDFDASKKDCTIYINKSPSTCKTWSCSKGKVDIWLKKNPKDQFGYGACANIPY